MPKKNKSLVICESPAKIKKIKSFLDSDYIVTASFGHIRDLEKKNISIDFENNFMPKYVTSSGKDKVIRELKGFMKECKMVYLASDFDREGEAIAWHISEVLKLNENNSKRILFTEITKSAILNSIKNPTKIDENMFYAQQARRVLDRIIGYLISPILWKQIQSSYKEKQSLSAGRVQSVVVKLIKEREDEIEKFDSEPYYKIGGDFKIDNITLNAELNNDKDFKTKEKPLKFIKKCSEGEFFIQESKSKESNRKPPIPFTTSSLQQEASSKLGISPKETMSIAQKLYENGHITYMRTDSLILSDEAHNNIKSKVIKEFGKDFYQLNKGKVKINKKKKEEKENNAQEAHEACRPTNFEINSLQDKQNITYRENRLYKLIWNRTIMSQMSPVKVDISTIKIGLRYKEKINKYHFISKKEFIKFKGYLKVYDFQNEKFKQYIESQNNVENNDINNDENNDEIEDEEHSEELTKEDLLKLKKDTKANYIFIKANEKFSRPPNARFTEASIIKKLDELGIGRPSTYATMVSNVQDRNYVNKKSIEGKEKDTLEITLRNSEIDEKKIKIKMGGEKDKLFPTDLGIIVNTFLLENFSEILEYKYTAEIENKLDLISKGELIWHEVVKETYDKIKPKLELMNVSLDNKERDKYKRDLGEDPESGLNIMCYIGKYGPLVKLDDPDDRTNCKFAPLGDIKIEDVTIEQALELLKFPKNLGKLRNKDIILAKGRYGLYIKYNSKNYQIPEEYLEKDILLKEAKEILKRKTEQDNSEKIVIKYKTENIEVKTGKYGPYFRYKNKNYSISKKYNINNLVEKDIENILNKK